MGDTSSPGPWRRQWQARDLLLWTWPHADVALARGHFSRFVLGLPPCVAHVERKGRVSSHDGSSGWGLGPAAAFFQHHDEIINSKTMCQCCRRPVAIWRPWSKGTRIGMVSLQKTPF